MQAIVVDAFTWILRSTQILPWRWRLFHAHAPCAIHHSFAFEKTIPPIIKYHHYIYIEVSVRQKTLLRYRNVPMNLSWHLAITNVWQKTMFWQIMYNGYMVMPAPLRTPSMIESLREFGLPCKPSDRLPVSFWPDSRRRAVPLVHYWVMAARNPQHFWQGKVKTTKFMWYADLPASNIILIRKTKAARFS